VIESRVGIGLVGLGDIAVRGHLPAILREPRASLVVVADADRLAHHAPAGVSTTTLPESLFADTAVDAVVIATPPTSQPCSPPQRSRPGSSSSRRSRSPRRWPARH
jgi:predicted dehydrogenase